MMDYSKYDMATASVQELQTLLAAKEARIRELEAQLRQRDDEICDLRSHLDKFQSVFPFHVNNNHLDNGIIRPKKQRAQGISAEPQSLISIQELSQQKFNTFPKSDSYIQYSNIAAKLLRRALKPDAKTEAMKRDESFVRFTPWKDGKAVKTSPPPGSS